MLSWWVIQRPRVDAQPVVRLLVGARCPVRSSPRPPERGRTVPKAVGRGTPDKRFSRSWTPISDQAQLHWDRVAPDVWDSFGAFCQALNPRDAEVALLTKSGPRTFWEMPASRRMFLVFGAETGGLPDSILNRYPDARYRIPISDEIRSLNLSTAAGIVLYESLRDGR